MSWLKNGLALAGGILLLGGCQTQEPSRNEPLGSSTVPGTEVEVPQPPPPPRADSQPPGIRPGYVWVSGYWDWTGSQWAWRQGHWQLPPRPGMFWIAPRCENRPDGRYVWVRGGWQ